VADEFLTTPELAQRLGVHPWTIKKMRQELGLPSYTWGLRTRRYRWSEVEAWMIQQREEML
jgi:excisionase family DNA binding protein